MATPTLEFLSSLVDTATTASGEAARLRLERAQQNIEEIFGAAESDFDDLLTSDSLGEDDMGEESMGEDMMGGDGSAGEFDDLLAEDGSAGEFDDLLGEDELGADEDDDFGEDDFGAGIPGMVPGLPFPIPPKALYMQGVRAVTRRIRAGKESKPKTQKQIARLRKLYAQITKGKRGGLRASMLKSPDEVISAARGMAPISTPGVAQTYRTSSAAPAYEAYTPRPMASSVAPAYTPRPRAAAAAPVYTNRPRTAPGVSAQGPNPRDASVAPHLRRGYRSLLGRGLWELFSSFPNRELNLIANQPQREPQVRTMASRVVAQRASRRVTRAAPVVAAPTSTLSVLAQPVTPAPTYTPTSKAVNARYARGGARYAGDDDFGAELPPGYEARPTLWTSITSHPFAAFASAAAVFAGGVVLSDKVKDAWEDTWEGQDSRYY